MDNLTNDAKFLLSSMYKVYIDKRKSGELKDDARYFNDIKSIHEEIMPEWKIEDVASTCFELSDNSMINAGRADYFNGSDLFDIFLTNSAIAIMEKQFKDKVDSVIDYASKIKSLIPFI